MSDARAEYVRLPIYREKLARALDFTESDLQINRGGDLSPSQRSTLIGAVTRSALKSGGFMCLAIVGLALWLVTGVAALLLIPLALAATLVGWLAIFARDLWPVWQDAAAGRVSYCEGSVTPAERSRPVPIGAHWVPVWSYYWVVDGQQRFKVPGKVYPVLFSARHRIYFVPKSRRVVAAEPIS